MYVENYMLHGDTYIIAKVLKSLSYQLPRLTILLGANGVFLGIDNIWGS